MRIGIITGEFPPMQGGVGAFSRILAGEMAAREHELFVLSRAGTESDDPRVHLTATIQCWGVGSLSEARRWSRENHLDVVNIQYQTAAYDMSPYIHFLPEALRPIPVVTTFHDLRFPYLFPKAGFLRDWIVGRLASASACSIVTNHEDYGKIKGKSRLIPIGSNILTALPDDFDAAAWRGKAGINSGEFLLVFFGLIKRSKGIETLLESVAALRSQGIPARLALVGDAGSSDPTNADFQREIHIKVSESQLSPYVTLTGFVDEMAAGAWLASADAVALPFANGASYRRGSLMAALHYGCAIVTTSPAVDIREFRNGENMLLVPPNDTKALTTALRSLHDFPELCVRLRQGAKTLGGQFDWGQIADETLDVFREVLA